MINRARDVIRESVVERKVCDYAESLGWFQFKLTSSGTRGVPDRIYFRNCETLLIEFKSETGKLSSYQKYFIEKLTDSGAVVEVIHSVEAGKAIFDAYEV